MKKIITSLLLLLVSANIVNAQEDIITMMTYNIKGWDINDNKIKDISKVINYYAPDIVAIQEVHKRPYLIFHDYLADIATQTGLKSQFFALVGNYYGIGILSTTDPISVQTRAFPFSDASKDKEDRGIIIAEFPDYFFISTHYSLNDVDRDTATKWICDFADNSDKTVFVAGDFNAAPTYRAMVTFKNRGFKILNDINQFTIPSNAPTKTIDMVISYSDFEGAKKYDVLESGIAKTPGVDLSFPSDHLPVFVNLKPKEGSVESIEKNDILIRINDNQLNVAGLEEMSTLSIIDLSGRIIKQTAIQDGETIDLSNNCQAGIYIVRINNSKQYKSEKLMFNN